MKPFIALLLVASLSHAAVRNVCASGCTYATIADALNVANANDVIQLKAGETFTEDVNTVIPLWFRSSQYAGLPARGTRINPTTHAPLMATIAGTVSLGPREAFVTAYDLSADTLTFGGISSTSIFTVGATVSCWVSPMKGTMPGGMPIGEYIIRSFNGGTHVTTFTNPVTGALVDLTSPPAHVGEGDYAAPQCMLVQQSKWAFDGIKIASASVGEPALLAVGRNMMTVRSHGPTLTVRHSIVTGVAGTWTGPIGGIHVVDGINHLVEDSYVANILSLNPGNEAKALNIGNSDYVTARNNYLSAQSIGLLTGGGDNPSQRPVSYVSITGNQLEKPGYMWYRASLSAPSGACKPGALARNNTTNQCSVCSGAGAWGAAGSGSLCPVLHPSIKNLLEIKEGETVSVVGNSFNGQPQNLDDSGQGFAWGVSVINTANSALSGGAGRWVFAHNINMSNNYTTDTRAGLYIRTSAYTGSVFDNVPIANVKAYNNYFDELSSWPMQGDTTDAYALDFGIGLQGSSTLPAQNITGMMMTYNTFRAAPSAGPWFGYFGNFGVELVSAPQSLVMTLQDNLFEVSDFAGVSTNGFRAEADAGGTQMANCNQGWTALGGAYVTYNAFKLPTAYVSAPGSLVFNGASVKAGCAPYGGGNQYTDADPVWVGNVPTAAPYATGSSLGGPLGTDYAQLLQYKTAAEGGTPTANVLMALQVQENTGSLTFRFAPTMGSCTATIYTSQLRTGGTAGSGASPLTVSTTAGAKWAEIVCASAPGGPLSWIMQAVVH